MRHSNVSDNQGFTILEALIVVVFVGILAAMAGPSYFVWSQRRAVDSAITSIQGAIKEAQRQAMARSRTCTLTFNSTTITSSPANCLITGDRTLSNVSLETSLNDTSLVTTGVSFNLDFLGKTVDSSGVDLTSNITIVVTHAQNTNLKRCLVVSSPLGLIGTGQYTEPSGAISARCTNRKDLII
ncbi:type II secretion system protein [Sphaerospermopsis sp. LEGE 00249]|uniref:pilus assembly FimT family protein n=1 Tax=Sphaerospermopsis sp. LEGE 00249 TaxID=1380707 RepID=UPI00164E37C7|nr:type II secretion system protein [Sphaerospermopsis sp. LEGE 00249]MBC5795524.1 type II secretion system protein [Sphaerospermopsis sp. LEGE 00249]